MNHFPKNAYRCLPLFLLAIILIICSRLINADTGTCGGASITLPFTDVQASNVFFCSIAEAYFDGLTNGTSMTAYSPGDSVPREQMAAFITRTQDSALKRANRRAAMQQWWTTGSAGAMRATDLGSGNEPSDIVCDGGDVWTVNTGGTVSRVRTTDGKLLGTWTGGVGLVGIVAAAGRIFVAGHSGTSPGKIYVIDPTAAPGPMTVFENDIGAGANQMTFDGTNLWTVNFPSSGASSISRVDVGTGIDSTFTTGFDFPYDILWDGANLWVADGAFSALKRVDPATGTVVESIDVQQGPQRLLFDGTNLWISSRLNGVTTNDISVVRAVGSLRGTVLTYLSSAGGPVGMAFDGERILICNYDANTVSLFKAADFSPLVTVSTGTGSANAPFTACSDGLNFWLTKPNGHQIVRF